MSRQSRTRGRPPHRSDELPPRLANHFTLREDRPPAENGAAKDAKEPAPHVRAELVTIEQLVALEFIAGTTVEQREIRVVPGSNRALARDVEAVCRPGCDKPRNHRCRAQ